MRLRLLDELREEVEKPTVRPSVRLPLEEYRSLGFGQVHDASTFHGVLFGAEPFGRIRSERVPGGKPPNRCTARNRRDVSAVEQTHIRNPASSCLRLQYLDRERRDASALFEGDREGFGSAGRYFVLGGDAIHSQANARDAGE